MCCFKRTYLWFIVGKLMPIDSNFLICASCSNYNLCKYSYYSLNLKSGNIILYNTILRLIILHPWNSYKITFYEMFANIKATINCKECMYFPPEWQTKIYFRINYLVMRMILDIEQIKVPLIYTKVNVHSFCDEIIFRSLLMSSQFKFQLDLCSNLS